MTPLVGVDIGGTKTAVVAWDIDSARELGRCRFPTDRDAGPERLVESIAAEVAKILGSSGAPIGAIGVAVPGQVDRQGRVLRAGKLAGWSEVPLREVLERRFQAPAFVEHDANAAALGERWRGGAQKMVDFVFLALGTGIGAGLVLNGELYRGSHQAAGEVGNMRLDPRGVGRGRDSAGHALDASIGSEAIKERARRSTGEGRPPAKALAEADRDPRLEGLAEQVADDVALAVVNIAALLDPEAIFLGGGTSSAGAPLLERVRARVDGALDIRPELRLSELGEDAQLFGALYGAIRASQ